jgi:phosphoribosylglycinamide formyltransferase-1
LKIAILISGRGSNMIALADAVQAGRIPGTEIALVISDRADAGGLKLAAKRGLTTLIIERRGRKRVEHEQEIIEALASYRIELICLAGFMRLISPEFIAAYNSRILNIHPSLLPAFPGLDAQRQAVEHGVKWSGCTVHFVDETLDGGPIIVQRIVPLHDDDTVETLSARILTEEHKAYPLAVAIVARGIYKKVGRRIILLNKGTEGD